MDPDACAHIGYMADGYPLFGLCNRYTVDGSTMRSCWTYDKKNGISSDVFNSTN